MPNQLTLKPQEVHIWRASLDHELQWINDWLSPQELQRANRFIRPEHRRRFSVARAILRFILAQYVSQSPEQLKLCEGAYGKPYLAESTLNVKFNVSHSNDEAIYAINLMDEVGIDIEWINPDLEIHSLMKRCFSVAEMEQVLQLPARTQQLTAFYQLWTQKEAYLKATGIGLKGLSPTMPATHNFAILNLNTVAGYQAALVVLTKDPSNQLQQRVRYWKVRPISETLTFAID